MQVKFRMSVIEAEPTPSPLLTGQLPRVGLVVMKVGRVVLLSMQMIQYMLVLIRVFVVVFIMRVVIGK